MKTLRTWIVRLCSLFRRRQLDREFGEEIESHLAMHIEDNLRAGMNPAEARRNALIKLGGIDQAFEEHRDRRGFRWLAEAERYFRYAFRILRKQKALSLTMICLLAVASAANTTIFSVYNCLYLRSFPYPHGERLVAIDSAALYAHGEENRSFDAIGFYNPDNRNYSRQGSARTVDIMECHLRLCLGVSASAGARPWFHGRRGSSRETQGGDAQLRFGRSASKLV